MSRKSILTWICITIVFVVGVLLATHYFMMNFIQEPQVRGQYGDMFGVADAIFSGFALVGVVWALVYQGQEVNASLAELRDAAVAHKEQARLSALAALIQAADASITEGDELDVPFEGQRISVKELKHRCLLKLVQEFETTERETGRAPS